MRHVSMYPDNSAAMSSRRIMRMCNCLNLLSINMLQNKIFRTATAVHFLMNFVENKALKNKRGGANFMRISGSISRKLIDIIIRERALFIIEMKACNINSLMKLILLLYTTYVNESEKFYQSYIIKVLNFSLIVSEWKFCLN